MRATYFSIFVRSLRLWSGVRREASNSSTEVCGGGPAAGVLVGPYLDAEASSSRGVCVCGGGPAAGVVVGRTLFGCY